MTSTNAKPAAKINMTNWNKAVRAARSATRHLGTANWTIGDAALTVATEYGENKIGRFSDEIGQEVTSVRNMRTVSAAYPPADIARDLQTWTVYAVFASQDDRFALVTDGNDGKPWTVSAARDLVKSRKPADGNEPADGEGSGSDDATPADELEVAIAEVARLRAELAKAEAKVAKIQATRGITPATDTQPARHVVRGIPAHDASDHVASCPKCTVVEPSKPAATVTALPAGRTARRGNRARVSA